MKTRMYLGVAAGVALSAAGLQIAMAGPGRATPVQQPLTTRDGQAVAIPGLRQPVELPSCTPATAPGIECRMEGEEQVLSQLARASFAFQQGQNPAGSGVSQRDFHPKQHACLAARFTVDRGIPADLARGVFARPRSFTAVLRYSNGSPKAPGPDGRPAPRADFTPDPRGLAIKVLGVPGEPLLADQPARPAGVSQDFVFINHPAFFLHDPRHYVEFLRALGSGQPFAQYLDRRELEVLGATSRTVKDVVAERYFSQVPYLLGARPVKYAVRPCQAIDVAEVSGEEQADPDYLRKRVATRVQRETICLRLSVQRRRGNMPVEDAAAEWSESESPFVDVATVEVPRGQNIDDPARDQFCEHISFNPWNGVGAHRPLGAINRARLSVYTGISRKRRMENGVAIDEPSADHPFFSVLPR